MDARGLAVGGAGDDHAAVTVAGEDDTMDVFVAQGVGDVFDVGVQVHLRGSEMRTLAAAGKRRANDLVAGFLQRFSDAPPEPAASPCAVNEDERSHKD